jgi:hypothetical protein
VVLYWLLEARAAERAALCKQVWGAVTGYGCNDLAQGVRCHWGAAIHCGSMLLVLSAITHRRCRGRAKRARVLPRNAERRLPTGRELELERKLQTALGNNVTKVLVEPVPSRYSMFELASRPELRFCSRAEIGNHGGTTDSDNGTH